MKTEITELYGDADLTRLQQKIRRQSTVHILLAAAALAACLWMIARTGTANAARMEVAVILVSTVAGWVVLYGQLQVVAPCRRELRHARMLRGEERQAVTGAVTVTGEQVTIRRSITARRVEVRGEKENHRLLVCAARAASLEALRTATLYTVHGYVAAYEVPR